MHEVIGLVCDILLSSMQHNTAYRAVESDLRRWRSNPRVDAEFRSLLPSDVRQAVRLLGSQLAGVTIIRYDVCSSDHCGHVYRCHSAGAHACPVCGEARYLSPAGHRARPRARRTMLWASIIDTIRSRLLREPQNFKDLRYHSTERPGHATGYISDVYDGRLWQVRRAAASSWCLVVPHVVVAGQSRLNASAHWFQYAPP